MKNDNKELAAKVLRKIEKKCKFQWYPEELDKLELLILRNKKNKPVVSFVGVKIPQGNFVYTVDFLFSKFLKFGAEFLLEGAEGNLQDKLKDIGLEVDNFQIEKVM